ncbi:sentrin-specific protease 1-like isoform X2 [Littorina saxatilis]|uniref:sentrin-specific protease 1-like isoform X2 n=1 Tax=Littorina saxatilis TaxID=31220 RepID=UPI0038B481E9
MEREVSYQLNYLTKVPMFKSLSNSVRSLWQSKTQETAQNPERKRKRSTDETYQDDSDVEIVSVKKAKQEDTSSSPGILSFLSHPMSKMSEWVRKKTVRQDHFFTQPIPEDSRWNRRVDPGGQQNYSCASGSNVSVTNGSHTINTRDTDRLSRPPINTHSKNVSSENGLNGDVPVIDRQPGPHTLSVSSSRRSSCSSSRPGAGRRSAADFCFQLQERQNYLKLLQQYTTVELGYHGNKTRFAQPPDSLPQDRRSQISGAFLPLASAAPLSSSASSLASSVSFRADGAGPSSTFRAEGLQQYPRYRVTPSRVAPPSAPPSDRVVADHQPWSSSKTNSFAVPSRPSRVQQVNSTKPLSRRTQRRNSQTGAEQEQTPVPVGDGDQDVFVIEDGEPGKTTRSPLLGFKSSEYLDDEWLPRLNQKYTQSEKERLELIKEAEMKKKLLEERREGRLGNLDKKLRQQMRLFDEEPEVIEELPLPEVPQEKALPELTEAMEREIRMALDGGPSSEVLSEGFRLRLTRADLATLKGLNWLNDEVINFYMNMLMDRGEQEGFSKTYSFSTFFYPKLVQGGHAVVKRWTRRVDIFSHQYLVIPVHLGVHWCLCVVFMKEKKICYYDSMGGTNNQCLNAVRQYLADESAEKNKGQLDLSEWSAEIVKDIPQQMNGSDCGMFSCMYAETLTRGAKITFTQKDMPYFRRRMVYEILKKKLL